MRILVRIAVNDSLNEFNTAVQLLCLVPFGHVHSQRRGRGGEREHVHPPTLTAQTVLTWWEISTGYQKVSPGPWLSPRLPSPYRTPLHHGTWISGLLCSSHFLQISVFIRICTLNNLLTDMSRNFPFTTQTKGWVYMRLNSIISATFLFPQKENQPEIERCLREGQKYLLQWVAFSFTPRFKPRKISAPHTTKY